jgi:hypothetical protein
MGKKTFRVEFSHIMPVMEDTPVSIIRFGWISNRPSNAQAARMALKKLLPKKLQPYISYGRQWKRKRKKDYLRRMVLSGEMPHKGLIRGGESLRPDWYVTKRKRN